MNVLKEAYQSFMNYMTDPAIWVGIGQGFIKVLLIFIVAGVLIRIGKVALHNIFKIRTKSPLRVSERREATLTRLLDNILTYVIYFIAFIMVLEVFTIDVTALLAGAGVAGLAIGFGAQNLVRDIITGFFIIFEDQFSVGDYIRTGTFEGTVEEIGLRITKIKSFTGEIHILPNGSIQDVTNFSIANSVAIVDISIAYEGDIGKAEKVILSLLEELPKRYEDMVKTPELLGVQMLGASDVVLRVTSEVKPMKHFAISRALRKEIKIKLDENGIEIPFPRVVMYNRVEEADNSGKLQEKG
ncbi:small conductance mechanosensitive channel [Bacillus mesophilus]|uniref:Mechanosensitive ion channel family protein n=1 Tax=Bacillus mesophilus TaxID=1808955 RepID=A0A6M0Q9U1_9BACI|nr:mechanosensitive ion channel family protein [Bacillus mesophilus]MBM7662224.1 small conductance mechanosensitive channel [Bacillus mesophilus]NEY73136.1 mechanosensitive ion channel family protein [Bacillus mesophilus]